MLRVITLQQVLIDKAALSFLHALSINLLLRRVLPLLLNLALSQTHQIVQHCCIMIKLGKVIKFLYLLVLVLVLGRLLRLCYNVKITILMGFKLSSFWVHVAIIDGTIQIILMQNTIIMTSRNWIDIWILLCIEGSIV